MVTPSAVVRVNRWVALPKLVLPLPPVLSPVTSGAVGIIGHAVIPEPEAAAPPPEPRDEGEAADLGVALVTCT